MVDERGPDQGGACGSVDGGFTIPLDDDRIRAFMEAGDFSSASELERFAEAAAHVERRVREGSGAFLALSIGEKSLARDFAVLQIAHALAKRGKRVLVVDCDFLHPGLSGLVENVEEHGFLDLLLYGSSLKSVAKPAGVDGMSVAGPGSFPVSRTIPFALKEFSKIRDFLRAKHDVVVYCSTLHTEDGRVNPLASLVDGVLVCCRIEDLGAGELERHLAAIAAEQPAPIELVCFCGERAERRAVRRAPEAAAESPPAPAPEAHPAAAPDMPRIESEPGEEGAAEEIMTPALEASAAPETLEERPRRRVSPLRIAALAAALVVAAFVVWWAAVYRTMREQPAVTRLPVATGVPADTGSALDTATLRVDSAGTAATADTGASAPPAPAAPAAPERRPIATGTDNAPARQPARADTAKAVSAPWGPAAYTVHIASFKEMFRAEAEKKMLESYGYPARIVEVSIRGELWLRVFAGSYATQDEAEAARLQLLGLKGIGYARVVSVGAAQ